MSLLRWVCNQWTHFPVFLWHERNYAIAVHSIMSHRPWSHSQGQVVFLVIAAVVSSRNLLQVCRGGPELRQTCHTTPANESPCDVACAQCEAPPLPAFWNVLKRIERDKCSEHRTKCSFSVFFFFLGFYLFKICCNAANKLIAQLEETKLRAISGNNGATEVQLSRELD